MVIDFFRHRSDFDICFDLLNRELRLGRSWPFQEEYKDIESFRAYFTSHAAFVCVLGTEIDQAERTVYGCFYVKPNFPGRCDHYCNGGFIVHPGFRGSGIGTFLGESFLKLAPALGYKTAMFNLVFASNRASHGLWKKLGFSEGATLPGAGRLRWFESEEEEEKVADGEPVSGDEKWEYVDATQYYKVLSPDGVVA